MLGISQSRNEKLSNVFYRLRLIEAFGTGIQKIIRSYTDYEVQPTFKAEQGAFVVILPNRHLSGKKEIVSLTDGQERVMKILSTGEKSRKEIENTIGLSQTRVINLLKELQELNIIERIKKGRNISYKIK